MRGSRIAAALAAVLYASGAVAQTQPEAARNADRRCLQCHGQSHIAALGPAERRAMVGTWLDAEGPKPEAAGPAEPLKGDEPPSRPGLYVLHENLASSTHANLRCVDCHEDAGRLPHAAKLNRATCASSCHEKAWEHYSTGAHKQALDRSDPSAPTCASCHGSHDILKVKDRKAPQHRLNALFMCGDCHKKHAPGPDGEDPAAKISGYLASAHAKAVTNSGLLWAATCTDCHGAHHVLPSKDPESSVHRTNVPATCGSCHEGILEKYAKSVHGRKLAENNGKAAVCTDCHTAHEISRASSSPEFLSDVISECGECHDSPDVNGDRVGTYYQTYHESYHGQTARLGGSRAARCSDCHGAHEILPLTDPRSMVAAGNLIETCGKCHPGANAQFIKFDPHANHRDSKNYPILHGVWLYFMIVMSTVFGFFGLHTILWFIRSVVERARHGAPPRHPHATTAIRRFTGLNRVNHLLVAVTFFGLTATGIPLVFPHQPWAKTMATLFGGIEFAGMIHRFFAILLIINFVLHFVGLGLSFARRTCSWKEWLFGPSSLLPRWQDVKDCTAMFLWFFGLGPKPRLDRWTYWEKFDYWAEVGGSVIIGGSGLLLWFPIAASKLLPGWSFNVAMIVHGYEALLAIGFIFTIHFFNAHIRPGTFPVDEVMFTGSMPEHELLEHRPAEYQRLVQSGRLEGLRVPAPDPSRRRLHILIAVVSVGIGVVLLTFIILGGLSSF